MSVRTYEGCVRDWGHVWFRYSLAMEVKGRLSQGHIAAPVIYHNQPLPQLGSLVLCHCAPGLPRTHRKRR